MSIVGNPSITVINAYKKYIDKLEAELIALKARRCETCAGGEQVDGILDLTLCKAVNRFSTTNTLVVPNNFVCAWWSKRET